MKTFLKVLAGLVLLVIIAVAVFFYTFDANRYKEELGAMAEAVIGQPVSINGDAKISFYPSLAINVSDVVIDNPPGFSKKVFASIDEFDIVVELLPLLQKRMNVEKLVLDGLAIDFERNADGRFNWAGITETSGTDNAGASLGLSGLIIDGVELSNANISWVDVATGKQTRITSMKLATEAVVRGQPLPLTFNALVESVRPDWQSSVFVKTSLEFSEDTPVIVADDLKLVIKALLPSSDLEQLTLAMVADGEINVETETARLLGAKLSMLDLVMSGDLDIERIFAVPVIHGPLKIRPFEAQALASQFKVTIPPLNNPDSLKHISMTTSFKTDFSTVYLDDISAKLDESNVQGFIHVTVSDSPEVNYDLDVDSLKYNDYITAESDAADDEIPLPVDFIRNGNLDGVLDIETVLLDEVEIRQFNMVSRINEGVLEASPVTMLVGESEVNASLKLDASQKPAGELDIEVTNVNADSSINPVLKNIMGNEDLVLEGMVNAEAGLVFSGTSFAELKRTAQGEIKISMDRPVVQGIDLEHSSRKVAADYANRNNFRTRSSFVTEYKPERKTEFDSLNASFKLSNGKLNSSDLLLTSAHADITGAGTVDLINNKLDYRPTIDVHVENPVDIRDKLRDHPIEYHAQGVFKKVSVAFNAKKYDLLVGRMMYQEAKQRRILREKSKSGAWQNVKTR